MSFNLQNQYMEQALLMAEKAYQKNEVPVGAVLVDQKEGQVIASAHNLVEELKDPAAHAEFLLLKKTAEKKGIKYLENCDLYVTLEPCFFCASAISLYRVSRVYFGCYDPKMGGVEHGAQIFNQPTCHHKPEIYGGIAETKCQKLLKDFFKECRK